MSQNYIAFIKSFGGNSTAYNDINWNLIGVQQLSFSVICSCFQIIFPQGIFPVVFFFLSNCKRISTNFLSVISLLRSLHKEKEVRMYVLKLLLTIFPRFIYVVQLSISGKANSFLKFEISHPKKYTVYANLKMKP